MRQERATELLRRHAQPRWDDLRAARVQKRVLEQLEIEPTSATPVRRWWWLLAAATVTAVILVIALGSWTRKRPNETRFADGSTIRAHDPARIVSRMVTGSRIEVEHQAGHATYEVTPRPNRQFTVLVGGWEVVVLGTVFEVGKLEDGVHVRVLKGRVEVSRADERFVLTAGEEVTFRNGAEQKHAAIQDDPKPDIPRDQCAAAWTGGAVSAGGRCSSCR